jgi:hypothetical protein
MCMNCGCGQPHEDHGKAANITATDLQRAGDANHQSIRQTAQHILETVELIEAPAREGHDAARPTGQVAGRAERGTPATES